MLTTRWCSIEAATEVGIHSKSPERPLLGALFFVRCTRQLRHVGRNPPRYMILIKVQIGQPCFKRRTSLLLGYPMTTWTIKSETDDPDQALANVEDQRTKGYTAWIEDENGMAVDEQALRNGRVSIKRTLPERLTGPLVVVASIVAGVVLLYLVGLWVE